MSRVAKGRRRFKGVCRDDSEYERFALSYPRILHYHTCMVHIYTTSLLFIDVLYLVVAGHVLILR